MIRKYINLRLANNSGSALLPVLIFILLTTILLSTVILYSSYKNTLIVRTTDEIKAYYLAETALQFALHELSNGDKPIIGIQYEQEIKNAGRIEYEVQEYGAYLLGKGRGFSGKKTIELKGLIGTIPGDEFSAAINLGGADYPLVVSGNTKITGDVIVGSSGIITGKYKGKGFKGTRLVDGNIITERTARLPDIDKDNLRSYLSRLNSSDIDYDVSFNSYYYLSDDNYIEIKNFMNARFKSGLEIDINKELLTLNNSVIKVAGNLEIKGESKIIGFGVFDVEGNVNINDHSLLKDVIIICDGDVEIKDSAIIKCQVISNNRIVLTDSSSVEWPGVLAVIANENPAVIECKSGAISRGTALLLADSFGENIWGSNRMIPRIIVDPGQTWEGPIYSESYLTVQGTVIGNLSTISFYIYSEPTSYINWLVDADVSSDSSLTSEVIPFLFKTGRRVAYSYYY